MEESSVRLAIFWPIWPARRRRSRVGLPIRNGLVGHLNFIPARELGPAAIHTDDLAESEGRRIACEEQCELGGFAGCAKALRRNLRL
jgi:hypothetical protein